MTEWTPQLMADLNDFLRNFNRVNETDYTLYTTRSRHRGFRFGRGVYDCVYGGHLPAWPW